MPSFSITHFPLELELILQFFGKLCILGHNCVTYSELLNEHNVFVCFLWTNCLYPHLKQENTLLDHQKSKTCCGNAGDISQYVSFHCFFVTRKKDYLAFFILHITLLLVAGKWQKPKAEVLVCQNLITSRIYPGINSYGASLLASTKTKYLTTSQWQVPISLPCIPTCMERTTFQY